MQATAQRPTRAELLKDFDSLPDAAHVRVPVVAALYGCSVPTIWRGTKEGRIPAPLRMSARHTAWRVGDLRAALRGAA